MLSMLKKELKQFVRSRVNLLFVIAAQVILILIFSSLMSNYVGNNTNNEVLKGKLVYYINNTTGESANSIVQFRNFEETVEKDVGIEFKEISNIQQGRNDVKRQEALAVITVNDSGYDIYRNDFNESDESKLFRTIFEKSIGLIDTDVPEIISAEVEVPSLDASVYYTFAELGFVLIYISAILAYAVYEERDKRTVNRILLSKSGMGAFLFNKFFIGILMAVIQIAVAYVFSTVFLDVDWGEKKLIMLLVFLCIGVFSTAFGIAAAMTVKKREGIDNLVLFVAAMCGYMGGAITPSTVLESKKVIKHIIKIDPLYWCNKALLTLYGGEYDSSVTKSIVISLGLAAGVSIIGVIVYEHRRKDGAV